MLSSQPTAGAKISRALVHCAHLLPRRCSCTRLITRQSRSATATAFQWCRCRAACAARRSPRRTWGGAARAWTWLAPRLRSSCRCSRSWQASCALSRACAVCLALPSSISAHLARGLPSAVRPPAAAGLADADCLYLELHERDAGSPVAGAMCKLSRDGAHKFVLLRLPLVCSFS